MLIHEGNSIDCTPTADVAGGIVPVQVEFLGVAKRAQFEGFGVRTPLDVSAFPRKLLRRA